MSMSGEGSVETPATPETPLDRVRPRFKSPPSIPKMYFLAKCLGEKQTVKKDKKHKKDTKNKRKRKSSSNGGSEDGSEEETPVQKRVSYKPKQAVRMLLGDVAEVPKDNWVESCIHIWSLYLSVALLLPIREALSSIWSEQF